MKRQDNPVTTEGQTDSHDTVAVPLVEYDQIFQHAPVGLAVLQFDSLERQVIVRAANAAYSEILERTSTELIDAPMRSQMPALHYDMLLSALNALTSGERVVRQELQFLRPNGSLVACQIGLSPVVASNSDTTAVKSGAGANAISLFLLSLDDITVRKVAEQKRIAEFGIEQREDFIATLTHDLKTPIVGANMVLAALLDGSIGPLQPSQSEIIQKLKASNQALLKMIHNLLDIYRYESGPDSLFFNCVDFGAVVNFCAEEVQPIVASKKLTLVVDVPRPFEIVCDEDAMQRVIINLLSNAIKFTPEGGIIRIWVEETPNASRIYLSDTGSGISAKDLERLFQRFWQGEPGKRYAAGTGLGLYFCNSVIRAHGGSIECQSAVAEGTRFTITLPKLHD